MQLRLATILALIASCSGAPAPSVEQMVGDAAAIERVDQLEGSIAQKDVVALNKAAKVDEDSAEAMEAQAASMLVDAKAIQQAADGRLKDEAAGAEDLRKSSVADAAAARESMDLERANQQADSLHLRQLAVHLENAAIEKESSAEEEQHDAASVEAEWLQSHAREMGDARALRFLVQKTAKTSK